MAAPTPSPRSRLFGGLVLWFALLGGFVSWAAHLAAAWSTDELTCGAGHTEISGTPLTTVLALMVVVPAAVTAAALVAGWVAWSRIRDERRRVAEAGASDRTLDRAGMMAMIAVWADMLFLAIIAFGGVALWVFPPCRH
jgi:hypothetical protein